MEERDLKLAFPHCKITSTEPPKVMINPKKLLDVFCIPESATEKSFQYTVKINSTVSEADRINRHESLHSSRWDTAEQSIRTSIELTLITYCNRLGAKYEVDEADLANVVEKAASYAKKLNNF